MPWVFIAVLVVYGLLALVFAVVKPPERLQSLFPIPSFFVFLPDRLIAPVGRAFVALCSFGLAAFMVKTFLAAGPP